MQLTLQQKLMGLVAGLLVATVVVALVGWNGLRQTQQQVRSVAVDTLAMEEVAKLTDRMLTVRTNALRHVIAQDAGSKAKIDSEIAQLDQEVEQILDEWEALDLQSKYRKEREQLASAWADYVQLRNEMTLTFSRRGDTAAAMQAATGPVGQRFAAVSEALIEVRRQVEENAQASEIAAEQATRRAELLLLGVTAVAAVLGLGTALLLTRPIVRAARAIAGVSEQLAERELAALEQALQRLAQGDLTADFVLDARPVPVTSRDELGRAALAFNRMLERLQAVGTAFGQTVGGLNGLVAQVRGSVAAVNQAGEQSLQLAGQISSATQAVAQTIQQVAHGSAQQAEQVTTASTATAEMAQTIDAVAKAAQEQGRALQRAVELAQGIAERNQQVEQVARQVVAGAEQNARQAQDGSRTLAEALAAMQRVRGLVEETVVTVRGLGEQSQRIGRIVEAIEGLTDQTNLLALNAAIEAARAGEAGKGFAVVAEEVRKLAERSSQATQEIAQMIAGVQGAVEQAVAAMGESAAAVEQMGEQAQGMQAVFTAIEAGVAQIVGRNRDLLATLEEIARRSGELRTRMEETAAIAEENSAAAVELAGSAGQVREVIQAVTAVSEQNAAAAEEVSSATEEVATQVGEVAAAAQQLVELARQLEAAVSQFRLRRAADREPGRAGPWAAHDRDRDEEVWRPRPGSKDRWQPQPVGVSGNGYAR
jgi:methyl-accepting chemotaxis protein